MTYRLSQLEFYYEEEGAEAVVWSDLITPYIWNYMFYMKLYDILELEELFFLLGLLLF